jgi:hypothetical protein
MGREARLELHPACPAALKEKLRSQQSGDSLFPFGWTCEETTVPQEKPVAANHAKK